MNSPVPANVSEKSVRAGKLLVGKVYCMYFSFEEIKVQRAMRCT